MDWQGQVTYGEVVAREVGVQAADCGEGYFISYQYEVQTQNGSEVFSARQEMSECRYNEFLHQDIVPVIYLPDNPAVSEIGTRFEISQNEQFFLILLIIFGTITSLVLYQLIADIALLKIGYWEWQSGFSSSVAYDDVYDV